MAQFCLDEITAAPTSRKFLLQRTGLAKKPLQSFKTFKTFFEFHFVGTNSSIQNEMFACHLRHVGKMPTSRLCLAKAGFLTPSALRYGHVRHLTSLEAILSKLAQTR